MITIDRHERKMAIQGHSRSRILESLEADEGQRIIIYMLSLVGGYIIMLALSLKVPKIQQPKALKIIVFDHPTVV